MITHTFQTTTSPGAGSTSDAKSTCHRPERFVPIADNFSRIISPRYFLARAKVIGLSINIRTGEKVPIVQFSTHSNRLVSCTLNVGVSGSTHKPGGELTVIYDDRDPNKANWAGRGWRNEPAQALASARAKWRFRQWSYLTSCAISAVVVVGYVLNLLYVITRK